MTCSEFENVIVEVVRDEGAGAAVRRETLDHAAFCARCAKRLRAEQRLGRVLATIAVHDEAQNAPPAVEKMLLAALRVQTLRVQTRREKTVWTWTRRLVFGSLAAGFVLVVFLATQANRRGERIRERQTAEMRRNPPRALPSQQPVPGGTQILAPVYRQPRKVRAQVQRAQAQRHGSKSGPERDADRPAPEIVTDFMPVVYDLTPIERGRLVRIQLPRSALAAFGLPMNEDRANEPVKADVLLDEQDEARAVRFVR